MKDFKSLIDSIPNAVIFERPEMVRLVEEVSKIEPKVILEIGTNQGKSAMAFIRCLDPELFITVDIANQEMYHTEIIEDPRYHYLFEHDAFKDSTLEDVNKILGDKKVDFLWIDGNHYPENVLNDWTKFSPLVREGGIVGFHDVFADRPDIQVRPYFEELKKKYKSFEFKTEEPIHLDFPTGFGLLYV